MDQMNPSKVNSEVMNMPFSWEKKPGLSKAVACNDNHLVEEDDQFSLHKLPPPSCRSHGIGTAPVRPPVHKLPIPPPPGGRLLRSHSSRTSSRRLGDHDDDPFFRAYKECAKTPWNNGADYKVNKSEVGFLKAAFFKLSCKESCSFRDDNLLIIPGTWAKRDRRHEERKS